MDAVNSMLALALGRHGHVAVQTAAVRVLLHPALLLRMVDTPAATTVGSQLLVTLQHIECGCGIAYAVLTCLACCSAQRLAPTLEHSDSEQQGLPFTTAHNLRS